MKKKIISLLLALIMALSLLPMSVLAADPAGETKNSLNGFVEDIHIPVASGSIILYNNIPGYTFDKDIQEYSVETTSFSVRTPIIVTVPKSLLSPANSADVLYAAVYLNGQQIYKVPSTKFYLLNNKETDLTPISVKLNANLGKPGTVTKMTIKVGKLNAAKKDFTVWDEYNYNITVPTTLKTLKVFANNTELTLQPKLVAYPLGWYNDYSVMTCEDKITLTLAANHDSAAIYVGNSLYTNGTEIEVSQYTEEGSDVAQIPIRVVLDAEGLLKQERSYTLNVCKVDHTPVITKQPQSFTSGKTNITPFTIEAQQPETGTISYEWYATGSPVGDSNPTIDLGKCLSREKDFTPPRDMAGDYRYICRVVYTLGGYQCYTFSDIVTHTIELDELEAPKAYQQLYTSGNGGLNSYNRYATPDLRIAFNTIKSIKIDGVNYPLTNEGAIIYARIYRNMVDSNEGGELIECHSVANNNINMMNVAYDFYLPEQDIVGTAYYYVEAWASKEGYPDSAIFKSDVLKLGFLDAKDIVTELEGEGSPEKPFLIKSYNDLLYVKNLVEGKNGAPFAFPYVYLALETDLTLPADWEPIGGLRAGADNVNMGIDVLAFEGRLDGRNHTLTVADGGRPLLKYARNTEVKNLNIKGSHIKSYGLVEEYFVDYGTDGVYATGCPPTITIDNVNILAGTKILYSGFIGGYASGANTVTIKNCTIEKGVVIGDDGTWGDLGDTSWGYPYVLGEDFEEPFVTEKNFTHKDCIGSFAGAFNGIITNCVSYATVYGNQFVGGLVGMKGQSMGPCSIINSAFLGEIKATGQRVGGIIGGGYIAPSAPLTPPASVTNCYVAADITGSTKVGGICGAGYTIVNNCFYYGKITGSKDGAVYGVSDSGGDVNYYLDTCGSNTKDDGVPCTAKEFKDGTVLRKLLANYANWEQGKDYPVLTKKPVVVGISVSGEFKDHYVGDELSFEGVTITAQWSDNTTTELAPSDCKISGYSKTKHGTQTVTIAYGAYSETLNVKVLKRGTGTIKVSFTLLGDSIHDDKSGPHTLADNNLTEWLPKAEYEVDINATVLDVIKAALGDKYTIENESGNYIQSITPKDGKALGEFTNGTMSGWMYTLNGKHVLLGVAQQYLMNGDVIVFHYTDDYTRENAFDQQKSADEVIAMIAAIGPVSLSKGTAIGDARTAYDNLTADEKALVTNYDKLLAAEAAYAKLVAEMGKKLDEIYKTTGDFIQGLGTPTVNSIGGEWMTIGLARSGRPVPAGYYDNVVEYVKAKADANERLHRAKVTDNARVILALTAIGKDVTNVGGHNLLKGLDNMAYVQTQGINGPIFTLIALDSHNYPTMGDVTREKLIQVILDAQLNDGGWDLSGTKADPDMTAMAIQSLAPYYKTNETVKAAVDKALEALSALQRNDGGFGSWGTVNSESCAQVIVALTALGIDPTADSRFVKNDLTVLDALASFYVTGGGFKHVADKGRDGMATEQGYYALAAYYRFVNAQTRLYDMSDVDIQTSGSNTPATGDTGVLVWIIALPVTILAATFVLKRKEREE